MCISVTALSLLGQEGDLRIRAGQVFPTGTTWISKEVVHSRAVKALWGNSLPCELNFLKHHGKDKGPHPGVGEDPMSPHSDKLMSGI